MRFTSRDVINVALTASLLTVVRLAHGQLSATDGNNTPSTAGYSTLQFISTNDSTAIIVEKVAKVLPRPNQTAWMRLERTFFIHFGVNTFKGVEWGTNAIDGNSSTIWKTRLNPDSALPHHLAVDMVGSHRIAGLTYLPRQDRKLDGVVENYRFETSLNGHDWTTNVDSGHFGNIRNNPVVQEVAFAPVSARFFRFTALQGVNTNGWMSAAEISVLPAEVENSRP